MILFTGIFQDGGGMVDLWDDKGIVLFVEFVMVVVVFML